jgi:GNAT superfamily N-acetyltransferase
VGGTVAGYFELHVESDAVELKYFGLVPEFTGRGIGGALLDAAIERARALDRSRMTVNTCTLDHPAALPNYRRHGFRDVRTDIQRRNIPA